MILQVAARILEVRVLKILQVPARNLQVLVKILQDPIKNLKVLQVPAKIFQVHAQGTFGSLCTRIFWVPAEIIQVLAGILEVPAKMTSRLLIHPGFWQILQIFLTIYVILEDALGSV